MLTNTKEKQIKRWNSLFEEMTSFAQNWVKKNNLESNKYDIPQFVKALISFNEIEDENCQLKYSHSQITDLCNVNLQIFLKNEL